MQISIWVSRSDFYAVGFSVVDFFVADYSVVRGLPPRIGCAESLCLVPSPGVRKDCAETHQ
jgi:hypothetical protein